MDRKTAAHLLSGFALEVLQRSKQFRDQLLASCLTFLLHLPNCIMMELFPNLVAPLQVLHNLLLLSYPHLIIKFTNRLVNYILYYFLFAI